jgi:hypothetical protein
MLAHGFGVAVSFGMLLFGKLTRVVTLAGAAEDE